MDPEFSFSNSEGRPENLHFLYKPKVTDAVGWDHLAKTTALGNCLFPCSLILLQLGHRGKTKGWGSWILPSINLLHGCISGGGFGLEKWKIAFYFKAGNLWGGSLNSMKK